MKKLLVVVFVVLVVFAIVWTVLNTKRGESGQLVITGSAAMAPLMKAIAGRFEALHPGVQIDVQGGGSLRGLDDVRRGRSDVGMVSRPPGTGDEGLHWYAVAKDGVALIVHRDNPVNALDDGQVTAIYTGRIARWPPLGGREGRITVISREEGSGMLNTFLDHFRLTVAELKASTITAQDEQVIADVANNPDAIGYVSLGAAVNAAGQGAAIKLLAAGRTAATMGNLRNGAYPLVVVHHLVTRAPPQGIARMLIGFARSKQVQDLIRQQDLVPAIP